MVIARDPMSRNLAAVAAEVSRAIPGVRAAQRNADTIFRVSRSTASSRAPTTMTWR